MESLVKTMKNIQTRLLQKIESITILRKLQKVYYKTQITIIYYICINCPTFFGERDQFCAN